MFNSRPISEAVSKEDLKFVSEETGYNPDFFNTEQEEIEFLWKNLEAVKQTGRLKEEYEQQSRQIYLLDLPRLLKIKLMKLITAIAIKEILKIELLFDITYEDHIIKEDRYNFYRRLLLLDFYEKRM